jgi:DNA polymerase-3 subunit epsilon
MAALGKLRVAPWPFAGPAWIREGDELHLLHRWRHLGTVSNDADMQDLLQAALPPFDQDSYRILLKVRDRMAPLAGGG